MNIRWPARAGLAACVLLVAGAARAQPAAADGAGVASPLTGMFAPHLAAHQVRYRLHLDGINAIQLSWWFQHIADHNGRYWRKLAPQNSAIAWVVDPAEDAHQIIGSLFESDQLIGGGLFPHGRLHMQVQYEDYATQNRMFVAGQPFPINQALPVPADYTAPYPSPLPRSLPSPGATGMEGLTAARDGFNEDMVFFNGLGFAPGRILMSWVNTGNDDTPATAGEPRGVDLYATFYLPWMAAANRPAEMPRDGYYYTDAQLGAIWSVWRTMFERMQAVLPGDFSADTQDGIARAKGWTVTQNIDTGHDPGVTAKMETWWWNHGMGDAPGNAYVFWCPPFHHTIRWLPGYSPAEVAGTPILPEDHPVVGAIYPDLQAGSLDQFGGGMMSYPVAMSPVPGIYKVVDPMMVIGPREVANLKTVRYPPPPQWLVHQWEDTPQGLVHRAQIFSKLPLSTPTTQGEFVSEHQSYEGLFLSTGKLPKLYAAWLKAGQHS